MGSVECFMKYAAAFEERIPPEATRETQAFLEEHQGRLRPSPA